MSTQSMPWFRMYTDFLKDPKIIALAFEDQRHFVGILALKSDGVLEQNCDPELMDKIVAQQLWIDRGLIRDVKKRLVAAGLIDEDWQPKAWNKRQKVSDRDNTGAERQRRYRERQKKELEALKQTTEANENPQTIDYIENIEKEKESDANNALRNASHNATVTRLDKNRIDKNRRTTSNALHNDSVCSSPPCPVQNIVDLYHEHMPDNPRVRILDNERIEKITERWNEAANSTVKPFGYKTVDEGLEAWKTFFEVCNHSDFLTGKIAPGPGRTIAFIAELDFLISAKGFKGCLENKYHRENA
ncbi:hypothetical protein [Advenella sp. EE-W14]|uniref:hypothetical protein n=1 Tax=Advenella sp. EE-W14 TaxID=2722705 RepID=UPI00145E2DF4|nr:hypothetical protein [Advenella sp. EE-W14]